LLPLRPWLSRSYFLVNKIKISAAALALLGLVLRCWQQATVHLKMQSKKINKMPLSLERTCVSTRARKTHKKIKMQMQKNKIK